MPQSRVLVVDDHFICNMETCDFLRDSGFDTVPVYCASAAFEVIARQDGVTALVTDIDLGLGADGFEVARRVRAVYPNIPVVYISGRPWRRQAAESVEGSQFISKPFHPRQIVEALDRAAQVQAA
jgi:DNA-binding NtrC family response regulator